MSESTAPKLGYGESELVGPGVQLKLVELLRSGTPIAPFKASRFTVEPGCRSGLDEHAVRECWIITSGRGHVLYDGQPVPVQADDILYFDSHHSHELVNDGPESIVVYSMWWP
jgi:mannose-6-phosphate isomerase-like protein (cupin superfamily)